MKTFILIPNSPARRPASLMQAQANRDLIGRDLWHLPNATKRELPNPSGEEVKREVSSRRKPGILDRISTCESREAAYLMWYEFLDSANSVSQKTINRGSRLLSTLDFPLP